MLIRNNESLALHTTYQIGGTVALMLFPEEQADFLTLPEQIAGRPVFWMGGGANILFGDAPFEATVINMRSFQGIERITHEGKPAARVKAGTPLPDFVTWCGAHQIGDFDYLAGIPGTIGGAVFMNAGAWRRYIEKHILAVTLYDLKQNKFLHLRQAELAFAYRQQRFLKADQIILSADLDISAVDPAAASKISDIIQLRKLKHPPEPSCGSVFKNPMEIPPHKPAGYLIEACGLKGKREGGAQIADKHANFIINQGGATAKDVITLIELAQAEVNKKFGIMLEPEVRIIKDTAHELFFRL